MNELQPEKHVCGLCKAEFATEGEYLDHECEVTKVTPRDPEHLGEDFARISEEALKRGAEQTKQEGKEL